MQIFQSLDASIRIGGNPDRIRCRQSSGTAGLFLLISLGCTAGKTISNPVSNPNYEHSAGDIGSIKPVTFAKFLESSLHSDRIRWRSWGIANLQTGDVIFTRSPYPVMLGIIDMAAVTCVATNSEMSHVGMIVVEDGIPMVYDISDLGVQRTEFPRYLERTGYLTVAVRRPHPSLYAQIPEVIARLRYHYDSQTEFDSNFQLNNDRLYCSEFIVDAFENAGIALCEPVQVANLAGLDQISPFVRKLAELKKGLNDAMWVYPIGNETEGLYGSQWLVPVLEACEISNPPS